MAPHTALWPEEARIKGGSEPMRMFLLTASIIGLQFAWGTEMTYCTPYLLSLGLSKSRLSLVWIAGPLSGIIMQPIIGVLSDKSTSKYGRRRPYMIGGTAAVVVCYLILGWAKEIAAYFVQDAELQRQYAITLAIADIYVLDFVINMAQSTCRALVVDALPIEKQQLGAAWIVRMAGFGHLMVYAIGSLDLHAVLGDSFGDTQFKKVCVIAALAMAFAQGTSCWAVQERVLVSQGRASDENDSIMSVLTQIYSTFLHVPERIQAICWVQFWSWIGWFPFLFYGSTWVGEIYLRHELPGSGRPKDALDKVGQQGSRALIVYSIVGTIAAIVLPFFIHSPDDEERPGYTARPPRGLESLLNGVRLHKPTLLTAWRLANLLFAASMIFAPLVESVAFATLLMAICGIPNAIAGFAPVTFLGVEVRKMSSSTSIPRVRKSSYPRSPGSIELEPMGDFAEGAYLRHDTHTSTTLSSTAELSGIYLGILNIYTTLPQFVGTGISWVVFSILEPGKSPELDQSANPNEKSAANGISAIGVCMFIGALSAMCAAWATRRLK